MTQALLLENSRVYGGARACGRIHTGLGRSVGGWASFFSAKISFPVADGFQGGSRTLCSQVLPRGWEPAAPGGDTQAS